MLSEGDCDKLLKGSLVAMADLFKDVARLEDCDVLPKSGPFQAKADHCYNVASTAVGYNG